METIKTIRKKNGLTQSEAAQLTSIPLRTFKMYENEDSKIGTIKYNYILEELTKYGLVDEEHGILSLENIKEMCAEVFAEYDVEYAILFGSYAKGTANEKSDIDLLISTSVGGLKFYEIVEKLRTTLKKKVDLLDLEQLNNNQELLNEILRDGVKIYG
ncbi:MAG: nucleotidyltransferase domain-containing protein [Prevotellaceae bacterium]|nr:nucleotidyltransferase domain-containing protein [Candidatus Faecinaster equi]